MFTQLNARPNLFIGLIIGLEHKISPFKMSDSVRQKLGHTNVLIGNSSLVCGVFDDLQFRLNVKLL